MSFIKNEKKRKRKKWGESLKSGEREEPMWGKGGKAGIGWVAALSSGCFDK
jgi:hypothetical protein